MVQQLHALGHQDAGQITTRFASHGERRVGVASVAGGEVRRKTLDMERVGSRRRGLPHDLDPVADRCARVVQGPLAVRSQRIDEPVADGLAFGVNADVGSPCASDSGRQGNRRDPQTLLPRTGMQPFDLSDLATPLSIHLRSLIVVTKGATWLRAVMTRTRSTQCRPELRKPRAWTSLPSCSTSTSSTLHRLQNSSKVTAPLAIGSPRRLG